MLAGDSTGVLVPKKKKEKKKKLWRVRKNQK